MKKPVEMLGNVAIAQFCQINEMDCSRIGKYWKLAINGQIVVCLSEELKFHSSWDWIIPVAQDILRYSPTDRKLIEYREDIKAAYKAMDRNRLWYSILSYITVFMNKKTDHGKIRIAAH
jgi:hypothetical protein